MGTEVWGHAGLGMEGLGQLGWRYGGSSGDR